MSLEHYKILCIGACKNARKKKLQAFKNDLEMLKTAHAWIVFYSSWSSPEAKFLV
jgi:hypothetical protein